MNTTADGASSKGVSGKPAREADDLLTDVLGVIVDRERRGNAGRGYRGDDQRSGRRRGKSSNFALADQIRDELLAKGHHSGGYARRGNNGKRLRDMGFEYYMDLMPGDGSRRTQKTSSSACAGLYRRLCV